MKGTDGTRFAGVVVLVAAGAVFAYSAFDAWTVEPVQASTPLTLEVAELPPGVSEAADWVRPVGRAVSSDEPTRARRAGTNGAVDRRSGQRLRERAMAAGLEPGADITEGDLARLRDGATAEQEAPTFRGEATSTDELLALAVSNDPFRPERRPGPAYVMPWERRASAPVRDDDDEEEDEPEWPEFRVVGFATTSAGGVALVQYDEDTPVLLTIGERIRGYELIAVDTVDGGAATLTGAAGRLRFPVREPRVDDDDRRRRRRGDDDDDRGRNANNRQTEELQRVQDVLRRLQGRGGRGNVSLDIRLPGNIINRGGNLLQPLSSGGDAPPRWSPDGNWVIFNRGNGGN